MNSLTELGRAALVAVPGASGPRFAQEAIGLLRSRLLSGQEHSRG